MKPRLKKAYLINEDEKYFGLNEAALRDTLSSFQSPGYFTRMMGEEVSARPSLKSLPLVATSYMLKRCAKFRSAHLVEPQSAGTISTNQIRRMRKLTDRVLSDKMRGLWHPFLKSTDRVNLKK